MRQPVLLLLVLLLPGCFIARVEGGPPEPGPEQFVFTVVPGDLSADEATSAVDDFFPDVVEADHRASVETPLGRRDFYRYTETAASQEWNCTAILGEFGGSAACGPETVDLDSDALIVAGTGMDGDWSSVEIQAGQAVASVTAVADDATVYRTNLVDGFGLISYPTRRGALSIQAFDQAGEPLGRPVSSEGPLG